MTILSIEKEIYFTNKHLKHFNFKMGIIIIIIEIKPTKAAIVIEKKKSLIDDLNFLAERKIL